MLSCVAAATIQVFLSGWIKDFFLLLVKEKKSDSVITAIVSSLIEGLDDTL